MGPRKRTKPNPKADTEQQAAADDAHESVQEAVEKPVLKDASEQAENTAKPANADAAQSAENGPSTVSSIRLQYLLFYMLISTSHSLLRAGMAGHGPEINLSRSRR